MRWAAMFYLTGHEKMIPAKTDVDFVGRYATTAFGSHTNDEWNALELRSSSFALEK